MKKKSFIYMATLCAMMSFSFVSCSDKDDDTSLKPTVVVTDADFKDTNEEASKISGILTWKAPESVEGVTKYLIYASSDKTAKEVKLGEVPVGTNSFTLTDINNLGYLLIVAANANGEANTFVWVKVEDNTGKNEGGDDNDNDDEDDPDSASLYVLNSGLMGNNNSTLTFYDIAKDEVIQDYFYVQNRRGLGDTAQDMIVYGSKMYIAVYGESTIEVTDLHAKSIQQIRTQGQPRSMVSDGGKIYVTYMNGYVARLDTASLVVDKTMKVGRNPEQLAIANHKLYVANSGGMDWNTPVGYDKTVSVVDLATFTELKKLDVVLNPVSMQADEQGNVYVVSMGNYGDVLNTFQRIDSNTDKVSKMSDCPNVTEMAYNKGILYMFYSQWSDNVQKATFLTYNTKEQTVGDSFIKDGTTIGAPYKIFALDTSVYVAESVYNTDGDVYAFDQAGNLKKKFGVGLNPLKVVLTK